MTVIEKITVVGVVLLHLILHVTSKSVEVDYCTKRSVQPSTKTIHNFMNYLLDFKELLEDSQKTHDIRCGSQNSLIQHRGLEDFYQTKRHTKKLKLPRKKKARVASEIQWLLTAASFQLNVANVMDNETNTFQTLSRKAKIASERWALVMSMLNLFSRKRKEPCYRQGNVPQVRIKETCVYGALVLRDVKCTIDNVLIVLGNCKIKGLKRRKRRKGGKRGKGGKKRHGPYLHCSKRIRSAFYNSRKDLSSKFGLSRCCIPKRLYSLSDLAKITK